VILKFFLDLGLEEIDFDFLGGDSELSLEDWEGGEGEDKPGDLLVLVDLVLDLLGGDSDAFLDFFDFESEDEEDLDEDEELEDEEEEESDISESNSNSEPDWIFAFLFNKGLSNLEEVTGGEEIDSDSFLSLLLLLIFEWVDRGKDSSAARFLVILSGLDLPISASSLCKALANIKLSISSLVFFFFQVFFS